MKHAFHGVLFNFLCGQSRDNRVWLRECLSPFSFFNLLLLSDSVLQLHFKRNFWNTLWQIFLCRLNYNRAHIRLRRKLVRNERRFKLSWCLVGLVALSDIWEERIICFHTLHHDWLLCLLFTEKCEVRLHSQRRIRRFSNSWFTFLRCYFDFSTLSTCLKCHPIITS